MTEGVAEHPARLVAGVMDQNFESGVWLGDCLGPVGGLVRKQLETVAIKMLSVFYVL